jgi:hypothetical protein
MTAPLTGQKGHELLRITPNSGQRGQMGQSDSKKEQQTATNATTKIAHRMCSTARRVASREAPRVFESRMKFMGWVGLEPTTNALKGRCSTVELPTRQETSSESITKSLRCNRKPQARAR